MERKIFPKYLEPNFYPKNLELSGQDPSYNGQPIGEPINWDDIEGLNKPSDNAISADEVPAADNSVAFELGENLTAGDPVRLGLDGKIYHVFESSPTIYDADFLNTLADPAGKAVRRVDIVKMTDNKVAIIYTTNPSSGVIRHNCRIGLIVGRNIILKSPATVNISSISDEKQGRFLTRLSDDTFVFFSPAFNSTTPLVNLYVGIINADNTINLSSAPAATAASNFQDTYSIPVAICRLTDSKFLLGYVADIATDVIRLVVGTVISNTITLDEVNQEDLAVATDILDLVNIAENEYAVICKDPAGNEDLLISAGTVSGTTPSTDEVNQINFDGNEIGEEIDSAKLSDRKFVIHYRRSVATGNSNSRSRAVIVTVDGSTTPTAGTSVEVSDDNDSGSNTEFVRVDAIDSENFVCLNGKAASYFKTINCTVSGTTITLGTEAAPTNVGFVGDPSIANLDSNQYFIICHGDNSPTSNFLQEVGLAASSELHGDNYIGILQETGVAGDSKSVKLIGALSTIHTSLSIGLTYYLNLSDGSLTLDSTSGYIAGIAESATSLRVLKN